MAELSSRLVMSLVDRVSAPARAITGAFGGIASAAARLRSATGITAFANGVTAALDRAHGRLAAFRSGLLEMTATGWALARAIRAPTAAATDWETMLLDLGQKTDLTRERQVALGEELRRLAPDLGQKATALLGGVDFLAGMGLDPTRAMQLIAPIGKTATAYRASIEDLAKAGYAALDNLKVPAGDFLLALDAMAKSGKEGAFELKDMAQYFPQLTAGAAALEMKGVAGVAKLAAALQIARKGAGDASSAATNTANLLQKIVSPDTTKNFAKFGIDIRKELKKTQAAGGDVFEMVARLVDKATKGDMSKLGDLFGDAQVQNFLRPLLANLDEYRRIRDAAMKARGEVEKDFAERMKTAAALQARFAASVENAAITLGNALLPALSSVVDTVERLVRRFDAFAKANPTLVRNLALLTGGLLAVRVAAFTAGFAATSLQVASLTASLGLARLAQAASFAAAVGFVPFRNAATGLVGVVQILALRFRMGIAALGAGGGGLAFLGGTFATLARAAGSVVAVFARLLGTVAVLSGVGLLAAAAVAAIAAAFTWLWNNLSGIGTFLSSFGTAFMTALGPAKGLIEPVVEAAGRLYDKVAAWLGPVDASGKKWAEWGTAAGTAVAGWVNAAGEMATRIIDGIAAIPGRVAAFASEMYAAGVTLVTGLWDGLKAQVDAMIAWFSGKLGELSAKASSLAHALSFGLVGSTAPTGSAPAVDGARAAGGPVAAGRTYLVGERGPELFTPAAAGFVSPNAIFQRPTATAPVVPSRSVSIGGISISLGMIAEGRSVESVADELGRRIRTALDGAFADGTV